MLERRRNGIGCNTENYEIGKGRREEGRKGKRKEDKEGRHDGREVEEEEAGKELDLT